MVIIERKIIENFGLKITRQGQMEERRIFARIEIKIPLKFLNLTNNSEGKAETVDISAEGIGFITKEELAPNTPLKIWLVVPNHHEPPQVAADVVWSNNLENNVDKRVGVRLKDEGL